MQKPKRFFGSARKVEEGGSLTIIATALVDTGSQMDEVIFEEFKGTGNMEIVLDRRLVDKRIWPAIDINRSGTRREEMLMDPEEHRRVSILRARAQRHERPATRWNCSTTRWRKTKTNAEFLMSMKSSAAATASGPGNSFFVSSAVAAGRGGRVGYVRRQSRRARRCAGVVVLSATTSRSRELLVGDDRRWPNTACRRREGRRGLGARALWEPSLVANRTGRQRPLRGGDLPGGVNSRRDDPRPAHQPVR